MKKGRFIVIEGADGSGKTTMLNIARELYGENLLITREPGGSPFAEEIRQLMLKHPFSKDADANTQFALIWGSRASHLKDTVKPALNAGKNVLCDRFDSSTWAYQVFGQDGEHLRDAFFIMQKLIVGDWKPDLYIFLDVLPELGLQRKFGQKDEVNHFDERLIDFHRRVRSAYLDFMKLVPSVIIDASKTKEEVKSEFLKVLADALK